MKCETLSWALPHQISGSSWFCWKTSAKTAWPFLSTNPVRINPVHIDLRAHHPLGLPSLAASLGVARALAPACPGASATDRSVRCPHGAQRCASAWDGWFMLLGCDGNRRTVFESGPHWWSQFWLASCKMKIITSHTSLPLAHLPRLPWKLTCCFWSALIL